MKLLMKLYHSIGSLIGSKRSIFHFGFCFNTLVHFQPVSFSFVHRIDGSKFRKYFASLADRPTNRRES